jgi:putative hydrolase of the HAD superfamily
VNRFADIDAVTIDGYGTLLGLRDAVGALHALVPAHSREDVERAFRAEARFYTEHAHEARDAPTLAKLHAECARVFNEALGSSLSPAQYNAAFVFELLDGVVDTLEMLAAHGLSLAVVANWDYGVHEHLRHAGISERFATVVCSAEVGAPKPDPRPFLVALERLGVEPGRAIHVGDHAPHDEVGARAAGMSFAPAPLATAFQGWT